MLGVILVLFGSACVVYSFDLHSQLSCSTRIVALLSPLDRGSIFWFVICIVAFREFTITLSLFVLIVPFILICSVYDRL